MSTPSFEPAIDARPDDTAWPSMAWPMDPAVELTGSTVTLTGVRDPEADSRQLFAALDDDRVWRHLGDRPQSPGELWQRLDAARAEARRSHSGQTHFPWLVRTTIPYRGFGAGVVIGQTSYLDVSAADARLEIGSTGYAPAVWASAVNPEAKLLLMTHAFEALGAGRVQLKTDIRNERSQRAIDRLGARYEGTLRRHMRRSDGTVRDTVMFSVIAEEWPDVRARLTERVRTASDR